MFASWLKSLEPRYGLDLRSLALLRVGLAGVMLVDLGWRLGTLTLNYSDQGGLPRSALGELWLPGYWSIHAWSGAVGWQVVCFAIAALSAFLMLIGYRTRWATLISWLMLISLHNRNPLVIGAADDVLRAMVFWGIFLPLGSCYSVDQALNISPQPQPKRILTGATLGLMAQQCYIYIASALSPTLSSGAVIATVLAWVGPLLLWSPIKTDLCRLLVVVLFMLFHILGAFTLNLGLLPIISCFTWLAFIPSSVWDGWAERAFTPKQLGLKIYYDAECGFCKKVVHLLRTFLVLPQRVPLQIAQSDPVIQTAMETQNSWVIVDWQGKHHYKWRGIAYVVSLSPIFYPLANVLRVPPLMALGTRLYETIANNRRFAGNFTKPFKYQSFTVRSPRLLNGAALLALLLVTLLNLRSIADYNVIAQSQQPAIGLLRQIATSTTVQTVAPLGQITRLDQSWHIFSRSAPD
ncbi:httm domain protein [Leptolyngbya sp. Heron Island J]|uniref:DCC1-like thiol-disulfide oxidoreductase family protein n=1 Tax=Leptolyngbya sp. Heron Island J TaxID=1385935 RepID=UPI0003B99826|nr:DCC1-like thiol-disulfide oxidoreductase family protein [Leptolyngbya sp. Heron Island J]ESA32275.1 httm domain protein [Leptolyngbya sp. Heron Island J]